MSRGSVALDGERARAILGLPPPPPSKTPRFGRDPSSPPLLNTVCSKPRPLPSYIVPPLFAKPNLFIPLSPTHNPFATPPVASHSRTHIFSLSGLPETTSKQPLPRPQKTKPNRQERGPAHARRPLECIGLPLPPVRAHQSPPEGPEPPPRKGRRILQQLLVVPLCPLGSSLHPNSPNKNAKAAPATMTGGLATLRSAIATLYAPHSTADR